VEVKDYGRELTRIEDRLREQDGKLDTLLRMMIQQEHTKSQEVDPLVYTMLDGDHIEPNQEENSGPEHPCWSITQGCNLQ